MKNKFCSNKANSNKNSFNSQYENTKELYALASEYEADFLSVSYEHISPCTNEFSITTAKELLDNATVSSDSSESDENFELSHDESFNCQFLLLVPKEVFG